MTALQTAAEAGNSEEVLRLLQDGADPSETDRAVITCCFCKLSELKILLLVFKQWTAVFHAVEQGHADVVRILLDKGADPNVRNGVVSTTRISH